jgi:hypothetical protein
MRTYALLFTLIVTAFSASGQCAMCKAVAESNATHGDSMASGLNQGIVYLMAFPYLLIGVIAFLIYRHRKKLHENRVA